MRIATATLAAALLALGVLSQVRGSARACLACPIGVGGRETTARRKKTTAPAASHPSPSPSPTPRLYRPPPTRLS